MQIEESTALTFFFAVNMCSILKNPANKRTKSSILFTIRFILFAECSLCSICVRHFFSLLFLLAMRKVGCCSLVRSKIQDRRNKYNKLKKRPFLRFYPVIAKVPDNRKRIEIWAVSGELWARCREWCCLLWKERFIVAFYYSSFYISQHRIRLSAEHSRLGEPEPLFEQKTKFSILMQVKVRTSKCRPNGLQQRAKPVVKP